MRVPTSYDVARQAGVSQPTVSRALRDDRRVAAATRERVREVASALGYVPSRRGRSLSTRTTGQIAVVVGDLANPFYMEVIERLHATLEGADRRMVVLTDPLDRAGADARLLDGSIDGAILTTALLGSAVPRELAERGLPIVLLNRLVDDPDANACASRNADGGRAVAQELVSLGHRRIGAILGPTDTSTSRDRERGFRDGLAAGGARLADANLRRGPFTYETGYQGLCDLLCGESAPSAIFCANDVIALGALNAARALGIAVPARLTVFGFDDIAMAAWDVFRLSTVRQDLATMAGEAVRMLLGLILAPDRPPRRVTVPITVVRRASHAPPPPEASE
jgi:LacI family transcriptional regulator